MAKILVTGATGNVGAALIQLLKNSGADFEAAVTDISKTEKIPVGVPLRQLAFDGKSDPAPFTGIDKLFLMRPPCISDVKKYMFPAIDAAVSAGVSHFVFLSLQGAERNSFVPHRKLEKYLIKTGIPYTFIRPSFFMQNLSTTHLKEIRDNDEIYVPAGKGRTAFIHVSDIAYIAFKALTENGHENKAYEITGSDSLTYNEVASMLSESLGRKITYKMPSAFSFVLRKIKEGINPEFAVVMAAIYTVCALGKAGETTQVFKQLTGKNPVSMKEFINENINLWKRG